jgi:nicotinamide/nicotinate riboside kinase
MIVAIGGVSNSGKSALAAAIQEVYHAGGLVVLCQDDFILAPECMPMIAGRPDWEHPSSIDHTRFRQSILEHHNKGKTVIAEGLMVYHDPETCKLFDRCIFIEISRETFQRRKKADLRWGVEPDWYIEHIWDNYLNFGLPLGISTPLLRINGEQEIDLKKILKYLNDGAFD